MSNESAYARAGVDIEAGERAVDLMKAHEAATKFICEGDAPVPAKRLPKTKPAA